MQLDARLRAIANFVPRGSRVADVGTDHGHLALTLVQEGTADFVIASDKNEGPLAAASHAVQSAGLAEQIALRQSNGLIRIAPMEVDTVCLAGMGGALMIEILSAAPATVKRLSTLVLQPQGAAMELRWWLYQNDWYIADEALVEADGRMYEIMQAKRGKKPTPNRILLEIGPMLWKKKPPLLRRHIEVLLLGKQRALAGMQKSETAQKSRKYAETKAYIENLEAYRAW
ncbi:class I SAM-dependent methyltransferase [uncultured Mitsuokella sp.]|uniref:tRNA (adenine(22)-N(1))-methyltransferase n=1 Tax=uncultured Mitsuokella sp. TaxID=453120 RepID=UPI0026286D73|nr:class I SAM-dependent methyltransferase [uncultured Mitsuokella sp.]